MLTLLKSTVNECSYSNCFCSHYWPFVKLFVCYYLTCVLAQMEYKYYDGYKFKYIFSVKCAYSLNVFSYQCMHPSTCIYGTVNLHVQELIDIIVKTFDNLLWRNKVKRMCMCTWTIYLFVLFSEEVRKLCQREFSNIYFFDWKDLYILAIMGIFITLFLYFDLFSTVPFFFYICCTRNLILTTLTKTKWKI